MPSPDAATPLCPKCGERGCRENGSCPAERSAAQWSELDAAYLINVLSSYIAACSMPLQGPESGALRWVTREQAVCALGELRGRVERSQEALR